MDLKKKIYYSFDLALFLSGILLLLFSQSKSKTIEIRAIMGELAILFPFIVSKKKEKFYQTLSFHFALLIVSLFIAYASLKVYVNYADGSVWWKEILAASGVLLVLTYLSYLLINFVRSLYLLSEKLISFLINSNVESKYKNAKKIIEKITAFIVTLTAMAASITALIASLKNII